MRQIDKNTVNAENQLKVNEIISYINPKGMGTRVLFVGNSITRHGKMPEIGWNQDWGMAASSEENDYVHIVASKILEKATNACFCICQASKWEVHCYEPEQVLDYYKEARDFQADIIIFRILENFPRDRYEKELLKKNYCELISYLNGKNTAKIILTTSFWKREEDQAIREIAEEKGCPLVELNDLGEDDNMKAIGLFEHSGVANHPGDLGMEMIAKRILDVLRIEYTEVFGDL